MGFVIKYDFMMDMLCAFDVLAGNAWSVQYNEELYRCFGEKLSKKTSEALEGIRAELGHERIGAALIHMLAVTDDFQSKTLRECFEDACLSGKQQRIGKAAMKVCEELIAQGFYDYWLEETLPKLISQGGMLEAHLQEESNIWQYRMACNTKKEAPITLWVCGYSMPQRLCLGEKQYVADPELIATYFKSNHQAKYLSEYQSFNTFFEQNRWDEIQPNILREA